MPWISADELARRDARYDALLGMYHALRVAGANPAPVEAVSPQRQASTVIEIPDDLLAVANLESEEWARDDVQAMLKEKYRDCGDWQRVRRAVGVGELPE